MEKLVAIYYLSVKTIDHFKTQLHDEFHESYPRFLLFEFKSNLARCNKASVAQLASAFGC